MTDPDATPTGVTPTELSPAEPTGPEQGDRTTIDVVGVRELSADEARELSFGRRIAGGEPAGTAAAPVAAFAPDGTLVALLADDDGARSRPVLVLAPA